MGRRLLAGLATVLVAGVSLLPAGRGQPPPPGGAPSGPPGGGTAGGGAAAPALPGSGLANDQTPVLQYAVALLSTIVVMVILCAPSRKGAEGDHRM